MFGSIGMTELIVIMVVALIVIGPKRLPDLAKSLGRALRDFKRATSDFQDSMSLDDDSTTVDYSDSVNEAAEEEENTPREPGAASHVDAPAEDKTDSSVQNESGETEGGETGSSGSTGSSAGPDDPKEGPSKEIAGTS
ncbi:MAG: twin-arginine translocase TatA/TatE family subunit [bacterium]